MTLPPIPPSDNLYKFTAIGGLILVVLSLYIPLKLKLDLDLVGIDMKNSIKEQDYAQKKMDEVGGQLDEQLQLLEADTAEYRKRLAERKKGSPGHLQDLKVQDTQLEEFKGTVGQFKKMHEEKVLNYFQFSRTTEKQLALASHTLEISKISLITLVIGMILTLFGFINWYFRFQIHQDRIIKAQAEQWTKPQPEREREEIPG